MNIASQYKINALKRDIKIAERSIDAPYWKIFLFTFLFVALTFGGPQILILFKEDIDLTSVSFMTKLLSFAIIQSIGLIFLIRYFSRKALTRMKRELNEETGQICS